MWRSQIDPMMSVSGISRRGGKGPQIRWQYGEG